MPLETVFPGVLLMSTEDPTAIHPYFLANSKMVFYGWIKIGIDFSRYRALSVLEQVIPRLLLNYTSLKIALIFHSLFSWWWVSRDWRVFLGLVVFRCPTILHSIPSVVIAKRNQGSNLIVVADTA